jgi:preprotein translocase subunit YajC
VPAADLEMVAGDVLWGSRSPAEGILLFSDEFIAIAISNLGLLAQDDLAPEPSPIESFLSSPVPLMVGLFLIFYFIFILPEKRKKKDEKRMMSTLKKNDRIVTIGGIHGTIVAAPADSKVVTIRFDESSNARVKVNRTAIATVVSDKESQETKLKETVSDTKDK